MTDSPKKAGKDACAPRRRDMIGVSDWNRELVAENFAGLRLHGSFRKLLAVHSPQFKYPR